MDLHEVRIVGHKDIVQGWIRRWCKLGGCLVEERKKSLILNKSLSRVVRHLIKNIILPGSGAGEAMARFVNSRTSKEDEYSGPIILSSLIIRNMYIHGIVPSDTPLLTTASSGFGVGDILEELFIAAMCPEVKKHVRHYQRCYLYLCTAIYHFRPLWHKKSNGSVPPMKHPIWEPLSLFLSSPKSVAEFIDLQTVPKDGIHDWEALIS